MSAAAPGSPQKKSKDAAPLAVVNVQPHAAVGAHLQVQSRQQTVGRRADRHGQGMPAYKKLMAESTKDSAKFWAKQAKSLHWIREFDNVTTGSFAEGDITWFAGGKLNVCANALDRHVWDEAKADLPCITWEGDEIGTGKTYTFRQALREVCRIANVLKSLGVRKGDAVTLYMPMVPEGVFAMLACARLGACARLFQEPHPL